MNDYDTVDAGATSRRSTIFDDCPSYFKDPPDDSDWFAPAAGERAAHFYFGLLASSEHERIFSSFDKLLPLPPGLQIKLRVMK